MDELGKKINNWMNKERSWNNLLSSVACTRLDQEVLPFHFFDSVSKLPIPETLPLFLGQKVSNLNTELESMFYSNVFRGAM